jgi:uncharacterized protein involved in exopolysaccharide biosynthesis
MSRTLAYESGASLGPHYEDKLRVVLTNVWQHKLMIIVTVAASLVIGIALAIMMPKEYTAEAYLREGFGPEEAISPDDKSGTGKLIALDASMLVETRARLLQSQGFAQRVVHRLGGAHHFVSGSGFSSWWRAQFYGAAARNPEFQQDMAARKLSRGLSVRTEPRVYLIVLRYTAVDPERAALVANAFVVEFLQTLTLQTLYHQREAAERTLVEERATLGEKHPKVMEAQMRVQAADALLNAQMGKTTEEIERTASGNVTFAQADMVPSSPNPPILIALTLLIGLGGGIAMAAFRGRAEVGSRAQSPSKRISNASGHRKTAVGDSSSAPCD